MGKLDRDDREKLIEEAKNCNPLDVIKEVMENFGKGKPQTKEEQEKVEKEFQEYLQQLTQNL